jgi:signal transduction histidine kinase/ActR/RegA family two-component response regulator
MSTADAYPFPAQPAPLRFAVALASVGAVYVAGYLLGPLIDDSSHFLLLGTAVMASAWFAGTGPALAATVAGAVVGAWEAPASADAVRATQTHLALFVVQGLLLTALVSELRRARRAAEHEMRLADEARRDSETAGRLKDEFLATISHELRTPLNSVLGWLHLLRTGKLDPATSTRGLEAVERNVRLQAQLTGDLLDVSKVLTGELRLYSRPVSLTECARQAADAVAPAAQAKGVQVTCEASEPPVPVLGDPTRLRQIVWHLLANAVKFTPRGGVVGIVVERTGDAAVLKVTDSGPGIDPEFLPRIFDRFTQEDPSPTRTAGGLGVGLSLVRDLVELHGGDIRARNRRSGTGAEFTVRFPVDTTARLESLKVAVPEAPIASAPLDGLRVLVLDQDADGRDLLRTVLQQRGAIVQTAASVGDALEALEAWRPDVLVSDSATPEHDSYALVGKVRSLDAERGGRIPAAALTAFARTDARVRQMLDAFQCDLPKPVEPATLAAEIARLSGRERRREVRSS